jgi:hypothetical protein
MVIKKSIQRLRAKSEALFYELSEWADRETAEALTPVVMGHRLRAQLEVYETGLRVCALLERKANEAEAEGYESFAGGMRSMIGARRRAHLDCIEEIGNELELLNE